MKRMQLSLRDLLWLIALCAMAAAWWVDHALARKDREEAQSLRTENRNLLNALSGAEEMLTETADHLYPISKPPAAQDSDPAESMP
jgi:hypothetical protein